MSPPKEERETPSPLKDSQDHHHHHHLHPHQQQSSTHVEISREPPPPLFVTPFDFEAANVKRPRLTCSSSSSAQWKPISSSSSPQQLQGQMGIQNPESSPSPSNTQAQFPSPDTSSSPLPAQETAAQPEHSQFRKGKFVSPVWKPHEMLWLARAWRVQYQGVDGSGHEHRVGSGRGKTRADKDREVAEFLNSHGVNRDAKTAATKWDNMLGEFRKVYEWERCGEREQVGKSYFRLSPYERKIHRLPASFDEQVFEELSQFMCSRLKTTSHNLHHQSSRSLMTSSNLNILSDLNVKALPPPPPARDQEDFPLSGGRTRQMESYMMQQNTRSALLGRLDPHSLLDVGMSPLSSASGGGTTVELRRIGRIRMMWEESVSLWAEEGEYHRGRVKVHGTSFLDSDELVYFDDSMVACALEAFEGGPLKGFSVDRFFLGQHLKVFGRKKPLTPSSLTPSQPSGFSERTPDPVTEPSSRCEFQDPTEYYLSCLKVAPTTLPSLAQLSWYIKEPPLAEFRLPLGKDIYCQLPQGKELFFTSSSDPYLDCKSFMIDILSSIIRSTPIISSLTLTCRDSFIPLWDDCINRVIGKFCPLEVIFLRKQTNTSLSTSLQNHWPNVTGMIRNLCLWRGEEIHQQRSDQSETSYYNPSSTITEKMSWTYHDLPYVLGYYTIGHNVTFCALSPSNPQSSHDQTRIIRTDLYSLDLSNPSERLKGIVPCWRIGVLLAALAEKCNHSYSDFAISDDGNGNYMEMTPKAVTKFYPSKRRWQEVKEIYEVLDGRVAHAERMEGQDERELALVFKPRGVKAKPKSYEELVVALKQVTTALVGLHDMGFMHRDLCWEKVMMVVRSEEGEEREREWFVGGFEEAVGAPQINPWKSTTSSESGRYAPEMTRGVHGVKVDMWGVGYLIKTSGVVRPPNEKQLNELERRCMDQNPEQRPTAADCYHQLLQIQSSATAALPQ